MLISKKKYSGFFTKTKSKKFKQIDVQLEWLNCSPSDMYKAVWFSTQTDERDYHFRLSLDEAKQLMKVIGESIEKVESKDLKDLYEIDLMPQSINF